jgi:hypothetical protein
MTTDADRAKPEVDQEWTWGRLTCRVIAVTPGYARLIVKDGDSEWYKRQRLPLAGSFELAQAS